LRASRQGGFEAFGDQTERRLALQDEVIVKVFEARLLQGHGDGQAFVEGLCRGGAALQLRQRAVELLQALGAVGEEGSAAILLLKAAQLTPQDVGVDLLFQCQFAPQAGLFRVAVQALRKLPVDARRARRQLAASSQNFRHVHRVASAGRSCASLADFALRFKRPQTAGRP